MFILKRFAKSSIKNYLGKLLKDDIYLNQMEFVDGMFQLKDLHFNSSELSKEMLKYAPSLKVNDMHVGLIQVQLSWNHLVSKVLVENVQVRCAHNISCENMDVSCAESPKDAAQPQTSASAMASTSEPSLSPSKNSIFYYESEEDEITDVLQASSKGDAEEDAFNEQPVEESGKAGYKMILNKVEKIANDFILQVKNVDIFLEDLYTLHFDVIYHQQESAQIAHLIDITLADSANEKILFRMDKCLIDLDSKQIEIENIKLLDLNFGNVRNLVTQLRNILTHVKILKVNLTNKTNDEEIPSSIGEDCISFNVKNVVIEFMEYSLSCDNVKATYENGKQIIELGDLFVRQGQDKEIILASQNLELNIDHVAKDGSQASETSRASGASDLSSSTMSSFMSISSGFDSQRKQTPFSEKQCFYKNERKSCEIGNIQNWKREQNSTADVRLVFNGSEATIKLDGFIGCIREILRLTDELQKRKNKTALDSRNRKKMVTFEFRLESILAKIPMLGEIRGKNPNIFTSNGFLCISAEQLTSGAFPLSIDGLNLCLNLPLENLAVKVQNLNVGLMSLEQIAQFVEILDMEDEETNLGFDVKICNVLVPIHKELAFAFKNIEAFNLLQNYNNIVAICEKTECLYRNRPFAHISLFHANLLEQKWNLNKLQVKLTPKLLKKLQQIYADVLPLFENVLSIAKNNEKGLEVPLDEPLDVPLGESLDEPLDESVRLEKSVRLEIVSDYSHHSNDKVPLPKSNVMLRIKIKKIEVILLQAPRNKARIVLTDSNLRCQPKGFYLDIGMLDLVDEVKSSLWNKAVWTKHVKVSLINRYLAFKTKHMVHLNIDQDFLLFVESFAENAGLIESATDSIVQSTSEPAKTKLFFNALHVSKLVFVIDYKPKHQSNLFDLYNFAHLRNSRITFSEFNMFNIKTSNELITKLVCNFLMNFQNITGLISGIKPLKPITNIFSNATNIIMIPLNTNPQNKSSVKKAKRKLNHLVKNTATEILELGCAVNLTFDNQISIYANQPTGVKDGLKQAGKTFKKDMGTVIAFVKNGQTNETDLLHLPVAVIRPFTNAFSKILLGICNEMDPNRKERMDNKYKNV